MSVCVKRLFERKFVTLETRRELESKCVRQLFLGSLLGSHWPIFPVSVVTVPEVFAKVNLPQSPRF